MFNKCYVIPTKFFCNADCIFCITKKRNYDNYEDFININQKFEQNLNYFADSNIDRFEITGGGEPFLNKNLQIIIDKIRNSNPKSYIKLYTNGNILKRINGIDELNISAAHWDKSINDKFMKFKNSHELEDIIEFFGNDKSYKLRLSVPLIRGGIDCPNNVDELVNRTQKFVDSYVLRPLFENTPNRDKYFVDFEYNHPKVEMDRNCTFDDDIILWWTDNNIYSRWDLTNKINA